MGRCPLRRDCTGVDRELLIEHGVPPERLEHHYGSESMRFKHCLCDGKGTITDQWQECAKYNPNEMPSPLKIAKKENRNMKIGIVIGVVVAVIMSIMGIIDIPHLDEVDTMMIAGIISPIYGVGLSSISTTGNAIQEFLESFFGDEGCLIPILLWLFAVPFLFMFGVISIVGVVRYFKRRHLLKQADQ